MKLTGTYNTAFIKTDELEESAESQIQNFLEHLAFEKCHIVIMPDVHAGAGAVIGFTATMNKYIIPNLIGVDIGCGIDTYRLNFEEELDFEKFDRLIREKIPNGLGGIHTRSDFECPANFVIKIGDICDRIGYDKDKAIGSVGTLGSGNHFIEIDKVEDYNEDYDKSLWLTIHTGSRGFGHAIATYHQKKAKKNIEKVYGKNNPYGRLEWLLMDDEDGKEYIADMKIAQKFAAMNREQIARVLIEETLGVDFDGVGDCIWYDESIKSVHNYVDFRDRILRKGAIAAREGEQVVIPLNMRDGIIIGTGKGNKDWNISAPHGAGRTMSRTAAREKLDLEEFKETMEGVWTSSVGEDTLDEAPGAYKDSRTIVEAIKETVDIKFWMKPVYNFKAPEKRRRK